MLGKPAEAFDSFKVKERTSEWDGEGIPPAGCRVEAKYGGEWVEATVAYAGRPDTHSDAIAWNEALVFNCETTRPFWADEFRPIRSEADKKRDEAVTALHDEYFSHAPIDKVRDVLYELYDAIAARKIPHIHID